MHVTINDVFDAAQLRQLKKVYREHYGKSDLHSKLVQAITPMMPKIDERLGQENDPNYLAYMVEYLLGK